MNIVEKALEIATEAHKGQMRWDGVTPYISHPIAVAEGVETDEEKAVALLHDVVEDTPVTLKDLMNMGMSDNIVNAVAILSKRKDEEYLTYLNRVATSRLAMIVKISDITHNLYCFTKEQKLKKKDKYEKYMVAREYLIHLCIKHDEIV